MRNRALPYGIFIVGMLVATASLVVHVGNGLTGEGFSESIAGGCLLGVLAGSIMAGAGMMMGVAKGQIVPGVIIILGGAAAGAAALMIGSIMLGDGRLHLDWVLAMMLVPIGMLLGRIFGAGGNIALGTELGVLLAAIVTPFFLEANAPNNDFLGMVGLILGGGTGGLLGRFIALPMES